MTSSEQSEVKLFQQVEYRKILELFTSKYGSEFYIPTFLHKDDDSVGDTSSVHLELRIWNKIRREHFGQGKNLNRSLKNMERQRRLLQNQRQKHSFHPNIDPPTLTDVIQLERKQKGEATAGIKELSVIISNLERNELNRLESIAKAWQRGERVHSA